MKLVNCRRPAGFWGEGSHGHLTGKSSPTLTLFPCEALCQQTVTMNGQRRCPRYCGAHLKPRCIHLEACHIVERSSHDLAMCHELSITLATEKRAFVWLTHLGHHSSPCDNVRLTSRASPRLQINQGLQQTVQVVVGSVIDLLKGFKPVAQIGAYPWCIIITKGALVEIEIVLVIIGKTRNFLT